LGGAFENRARQDAELEPTWMYLRRVFKNTTQDCLTILFSLEAHMKTLWKFTLSLITLIIVVLILITCFFSFYLTPNKLKALITEKVTEHTNMELHIKGDLKWTFYPHLSLSVQDIELDNKDNTREHINVGKLDIGVKLLPLLQRKIEPTVFTLDDVHYSDNPEHDFALKEAKLNTNNLAFDKPFPLDLFLHLNPDEGDLHLHLLADTTVSSDFNHIDLHNYQLNINQQVVTGDLSANGINAPNKDKSLLQTLTLKGSAQSKQLNVENIELNSIALQFDAEDAILTARPVSLSLYGGSIIGSAVVNLQSATPSYSITANATDIDLGPLLKAATGKESLTGKTSIVTDLTTSGKQPDELTKQLHGNVSASIHDGQVNQKEINQSIQKAMQMLHQHSKSKKLTFSSLESDMIIKNGIGDLTGQLLSKSLTAKAKGSVDLVNQTLNINLDAKYINSKKTENYTIPLKITGNINSPSIHIDTQSLINQLLTQQSNQLLTHPGKQLGGIDLSKLFG
jgi:uncharacterized protein involved in outer membrane biogenesis